MAAPGSEVRLRVAAVLENAGRIVLVRHVKDTAAYHLLPGGGVEVGETLGAALVREVAEETGLVVRVLRPLFFSDAIAPDGSRHMVQVTFLVEQIGGSITATPDDPRVAAVDLVEFADLTTIDLRPPMGEALQTAAAEGFTTETRYLGPLWSD